MADVKRFIAAAHKRGLRIITELVINHTSDQHPWFQRARRAKPGSVARNFYVWSDTDQKYQGTRIIFIDTERSNWTWDPVANAYYWHRFYSHQPDLNFDNPHVVKAVLGIMHFWLDLGVDGLRLDAVPYLVEREGTSNENLPETHAILKRIRAEIEARYPDRMLLAEANQWPEDVQEYFGAGDECHMAFHFPLMPRMYMAVAQEDRFPITDILRQTPDIPSNCQWAIFLRNHDELTLEMVTDKERDYLWSKYASDNRARLNLGIRRRLSPLLERDRRRIELLNSLLLSMPGTPVLYYGDELGMGDNIYLGDRDGVRTPMQWSSDRNGGFSRADPATLVLPPIMDSLYGYDAINVEAQARDPHSPLNWMRRMLALRSQHKAFGRGSMKVLYPNNRHLLAYLRQHSGDDGQEETILCVANVGRSAQAVELDLSSFAGRIPVEMIGGSAFPPIGQLPYLLTLPPYGFYWFMLAAQAHMPSWYVAPPEPLPELATLVVRNSIDEVAKKPLKQIIENDLLPSYLLRRRWFAAKNEKIERACIAQATLLPETRPPVLWTEIEVKAGGELSRYSLPLGLLPDEDQVTALPHQLALSRLRQKHRVGHLTDAYALNTLPRTIIRFLRAGRTLRADDGELRFLPTSQLERVQVADDAEVRRLSAEQSNSSLIVGDQFMFKLLRRLNPGAHPEAEMGRVLTERGYANIAPLLGEVTRVAGDGTPWVLAVVQGYLHNQGDAWNWLLALIERALAEIALPADGSQRESAAEMRKDAEDFAAAIGKRLGEMHAVLAQESADDAFAPKISTAADTRAWARAAAQQIEQACTQLGKAREQLSESERKCAEQIVASRARLVEAAQKLAAGAAGSLMTRTHGDLHLGQILVAQEDAYFVDFEGEPARPLAERRAKTSPLRDVAGMLRSFDYAAAQALNAHPGATLQQREFVDQLRDGVITAFSAAYERAAAVIAHRWSSDKTGPRAALDLFLLEKGAYEICYEAANRPAWLMVPLRGLAAIAKRLGALEAHHG
ncbi:MAG TPA: maltose alpha-D-glucosyltransferase, partial [Nevskiaceae bacterium]|nr:maltose alpha-D-glucosyltransferase [Nevskiaceae bacterium]